MSSCTNFEGITKLTQEIARVLKTGGRCLMTTPNVASYLNISLILRGTHPFMYPLHYREYTRYEIETVLNNVGVNIIYFDSHSVFMCDEKVIKSIRYILESFKLPTQDRGDDFFIVFQKPSGFIYKEINNPGLGVYPNMRREPIMPIEIFESFKFGGDND